MQDEKKGLYLNLCALGFDVQTLEVKYGCQFDEYMFDKPNKRAFEVVIHFLFQKLNRTKANELYRACFPGTDKKCTQEFRKVTYTWLKKISEENPSFGIPKVCTTLLMSPGGKELIHLMFMFSTFVLYKCTALLSTDNLLLPLTLHKKRSQAQLKTLQVLSLENFHLLIKDIQLIRKTDLELQAFADEQIKAYHALQKKKKLLLQKKKQLLKNVANLSEFKQSEQQKSKMRKLEAKKEKARFLWNHLSKCVKELSPYGEILSSVLNSNANAVKLDGSTLHPTIPAKLLDECQEEIYKTVGTSLYESGKINLISLIALENLALSLVIDTLHEERLPNFTKQDAWYQNCLKIHKDGLAKLYDIQTTLKARSKDLQLSIKQTASALDALYESDFLFETNAIGLDVPDSLADTEKKCNDFLKEDEFSLSEEGIAIKYLLPSDDPEFFNRIFASSEEVEKSSCKVQLETESKDLLIPTSSVQAWEIPAFDKTPIYSPRNRKLFKNKGLSTRGKGSLYQGKSKRAEDDNVRSERFRRNLMLESSGSSLNRCGSREISKKSSRTRLSISLPSSPLMTYRSDDVIVERSFSRTPEAERKLAEQIVNCTVEASNRSPLLVYGGDEISQLDRTAFLPRDKIPRTPPSTQTKSSRDLLGTDYSSNQNQCGLCDNDDIIEIHFRKSAPSPSGLTKGFHNDNMSHISNHSGGTLSKKKDASELDTILSCSSLLGLTRTTSDISSEIDQTLDSLNTPTTILNITPPSFDDIESLESDGENKMGDCIPVTDNLISLEDNSTTLKYSSKQLDDSNEAKSKAVDLLMSTPPPLEEDLDSKNINQIIGSSALLPPSSSKDPVVADTESTDCPYKKLELNLLPVPDFRTPELMRFKSVLERK